MNRRDFLRHGSDGFRRCCARRVAAVYRRSPVPTIAKWRTFEVTSRIEIADPVGASRAWVPVPLTNNTDYFKREPDSWNGNYKTVRQVQTDKFGTGMVFRGMGSWREGPDLGSQESVHDPGSRRRFERKTQSCNQRKQSRARLLSQADQIHQNRWYCRHNVKRNCHGLQERCR